MLDKSVPYAGFYMVREPGALAPVYPLPGGFRFTFYEEGDEISWARIEASVLEFSSEFAALVHFREKFSDYQDELRKRCIFIENVEGRKVATSMAWWLEIAGHRQPRLHWVAVEPNYQGIGLGKAIISRVTELMTEHEGDVAFCLSTQTWSYKAVNIYKEHGYEPTAAKAYYTDHRDNYKKAMKILKKLKR